MTPKENDLETIIEQTLLKQNYQKRTNQDYDKTLCLIPRDVINFIQKTQPEEWEKYCENKTATDFLNHLANELHSRPN